MGQLNVGITDLNPDFGVAIALEQIQQDTGNEVYVKPKLLSKFGRNEALGTGRETVSEAGGNEVYPSTNVIDTISSSNAGDTQAVKIEGHTVDGSGNFTFVVQSATLNGQNKVVLTTPLARATRLYNDDSTDFAGTVYCYEDDTVTAGVPDTATKIHLVAVAPANQTEKCATTISQNDYWIITEVTCGVQKKTAATVDFILQIREKGKVFRDVYYLGASDSNPHVAEQIAPPIIAPANSDVRMVAVASTTNVDVTAQIRGYLALVA